MSEKVYLSGPISLGGTLSPREIAANCDRFRQVRERLTAEGKTPLCPTLIAGEPDWTWQKWMREAIALLLQADKVHLLPGWEQSPGCRVEIGVAHALSLIAFMIGTLIFFAGTLVWLVWTEVSPIPVIVVGGITAIGGPIVKWLCRDYEKEPHA